MNTIWLPALFWMWLFLACSTDWTNNPDYAHGWFAAALAVYFLWRRIQGAGTSCCSPRLRALAITAIWLCCLAVFPLELLRQTPIYWRLFHWSIYGCVVVVTLAFALLAGGKPRAQSVLFPLVFLATAVPWPTAIENPITLGSMQVIASGLTDLLPLWGIPVERQGTVLVLENCSVGVEEACSGIRSLQSSLMIALASGELFKLGLAGRIVTLLSSLFLAIAVNAARTLMLVVAGLRDGSEGIAHAHDPVGFSALLALTIGTVATAWLISKGTSPWQARTNIQPQPGSSNSPLSPMKITGHLPWAVGVVLLGFLMAHGWFLLHEISSSRRSPVTPIFHVNPQSTFKQSALPPLLSEMLDPSEGAMLSGSAQDGVPVHGYHFFWDKSRADAEKFFHRPDVCMPGGGWEPAGDPSLIQSHQGRIPWVALPYQRDGRHGLLLWSAWLNGKPMDLELGGTGNTQQRALWDLLANGTRNFTFEVAAILVPYSGKVPPTDKARSTAESLFLKP